MQKPSLSSTEYRILVEQAPIMIWRSDLTMGCNYFNSRWLEFTGRPLEEEQGNGWATGVHPDDFDRCLKIYTTSFPKQEIFEMEYRLKRADGAWRWIFDRGVPWYDDTGDFAGFIGSCIDVTARVDAERKLAEAQAEEIKRLRGFLPICASCKKIRDDKGFWNDIENYISEHSDATFSHGICPTCKEELYGAHGTMMQ